MLKKTLWLVDIVQWAFPNFIRSKTESSAYFYSVSFFFNVIVIVPAFVGFITGRAYVDCRTCISS